MPSQESLPTSEESQATLKHGLGLQEFFEFQQQASRIIETLQKEIDTAKEQARQKIAGLLIDMTIPTAITAESISGLEIATAHQLATVVQDVPEVKPSQPTTQATSENKPSQATTRAARTEKRVQLEIEDRLLAIIENSSQALTNTEVLKTYSQRHNEDPINYSKCSNTLASLNRKQLIQKRSRGLYERREPAVPQPQPNNAETEEQITSTSIDLDNNRKQERIFDMGALLLLRLKADEIQELLADRDFFSGQESEIIEHRQEWDFADKQRLGIEQISQILDMSEQEVQDIEHEILERLNRLFEQRYNQTVKSILLSQEAEQCLENLDTESREEFMMHRQQSKISLAERLLAVKGCHKNWYKIIKTTLQTHCSDEQYKALSLLYGLASFRAYGGVTQALSKSQPELRDIWKHKKAGLLSLCEGAELESRPGILGKILTMADAHLDAQSTGSL